MKHSARIVITALFALLVAPSVAIAAGDARLGASKAYTCLGCHGIPNYSNAYPNYRVPMLGGQHAEYLVSALGEYKDGSRKHPTMGTQASSLSDADVQNIAAYFAVQAPVVNSAAKLAAEPAKAKVCATCHGANGISTAAMYPKLAGQQSSYISHALHAYKNGERTHAIMGGQAANLTDAEIQALSLWFSSQASALTTVKRPTHPVK